MTDIEKINESLFESIKHINEYGQEYWTARELMLPLQYKKWQNFDAIIQKAKQACKSSNGKVSDHFANVSKMVTAGVAAKSIDDYHLSRYACYLIAMNGDPRKQAIALAQTYFAVKTRQQELVENYNKLPKDLPTPEKSVQQIEREQKKKLQ